MTDKAKTSMPSVIRPQAAASEDEAMRKRIGPGGTEPEGISPGRKGRGIRNTGKKSSGRKGFGIRSAGRKKPEKKGPEGLRVTLKKRSRQLKHLRALLGAMVRILNAFDKKTIYRG